jgi:DHA3 family tetracycline resistance protein-like MFS transporter
VYLGMTGATALFDSLAFTLAAVYFVQDVGLNPLQLVLVGTAMETTAFLFEIPTGIVADVYSRRLSVIIGVVLIGAAYLLTGAFALFETIILAQVVWSIGYTFTSGATEAWIADEVGETKVGPLYLRGTQAGQIGTLLGIVLSVGLAGVDLRLPILVGGVLRIALGVLLALVMPEHGFAPVPREERSSWQAMGHTVREGFGLIRRRPVLFDLMTIGLFLGLWSEGFDRLWEAHFLKDFAFPQLGGFKPNVWFGIMRVGMMLLALAATEVVRRRVDTTSHRAAVRALFLINGLMVAGLLAFGLAAGFGMALTAFWSVSVLRRLNIPISLALINQSIEPGVRATVLSVRSQVDALGQTVAGPFLGLLGTQVSISAVMVASGVILSPVLPLYARLARRKVC